MHCARAPALSVACSTDPARSRAQLLVETILVGNGFGAPLPKVAPADKPWHTAKIALISAVLWVPTGIVMMARPAPAASAPGAATGLHVHRPAAGVPGVAEGAPGRQAGSWVGGCRRDACARLCPGRSGAQLRGCRRDACACLCPGRARVPDSRAQPLRGAAVACAPRLCCARATPAARRVR
jgi:hypothetical protein